MLSIRDKQKRRLSWRKNLQKKKKIKYLTLWNELTLQISGKWLLQARKVLGRCEFLHKSNWTWCFKCSVPSKSCHGISQIEQVSCAFETDTKTSTDLKKYSRIAQHHWKSTQSTAKPSLGELLQKNHWECWVKQKKVANLFIMNVIMKYQRFGRSFENWTWE